MANLTTPLAAKQELAVTRGPVGPSGPEYQRPLYCSQETITATATITLDRVRFATLPAGAQVVSHLSFLSTTGSNVAGKLVFTPLDGSSPIEFSGLTLGADSGTGRLVPIVVELTIPKESFVDFVPTTPPSVTSGTSFRARMVYSLTH